MIAQRRAKPPKQNTPKAYFHEATTPNVFLRIDHSGEVYRSIR